MRLLSRLSIILVVCLVAMALPAAPAQANGAYITLSRSSGVPGQNITVHGSNFTANVYVDIYYDVDGDGEWVDEEWIADKSTGGDGNFAGVSFEVPESYRGGHTIRAVEITSGIHAEAIFQVKPRLTIDPAEGPVNTSVTVEGHGFAESEAAIELRYYLNGNHTTVASNIPAGANGYWTTSFRIPSSAKGNHKIDAKGNSTGLATVEDATFEVMPGITLDKSSGIPGEGVMITGNGFVANDRYITIAFAGQEMNTETRVDADANGHWDKGFEVPDMSKGTYAVTAEGDRTKGVTGRNFEIKPGLVLSPAGGYVGMNLSLSGRGFAASKGLNITYDGSQEATDTTDSKGSFDAVFPVPESQHGQRQVIVTDSAGNSAAAIFTMESDPPGTSTLTSPVDGGRVGFMGNVTATFEWSAVADDSGVYYTLQIAASDNVTATGEFADPVVSVPGLVTTNYTLNATQALSYGTYYWIVQAVDRAGNAGNWTTARSFQAGLLPMWGFIAAIAAIMVLIGALVYFFVIRRKVHYY